MKSFRTIVPPYPAPFQLSHTDRLLLAGSCFTEHIGNKLTNGKFKTLVNPNGIIYNPVSIARVLEGLIQDDFSSDDNLFELNGLWHSWDHHGDFSHPDRDTMFQNIEQARLQAADFFSKTNHLLLTLGTAQVFLLKKSGQIVANNHKAPADWFEQRRLGTDEVVETLGSALVALRNQRPELQVLLSVSPVRHLRNGFVENQRSKAVLVLACAALSERFDFVHYFPAYELMLDELRDYRFYAADMVHPNEIAIDYIWEYFSTAFFSNETQNLLEQIGRITSAARHRPLHPDTTEHQTFAKRQLEAIDKMLLLNPQLDFSVERDWFEQFCS